MSLDTTEPASRSTSHRLVRRVLALVIVTAALVAAGHALGYRVNLQTRSVPVPPATASPDDVVLAYVEAYDHRDFTTMRTIYPSGQAACSRVRAMGTIRDVRITRSRPATTTDLSGRSPAPGHSYHVVEVTLDHTGLTGSDLAYRPGPDGWTYWLERTDAAGPWTIVDQGNG